MATGLGRNVRPPFNAADLDALSGEQANRLIFDWWCDETDRPLFIDSLQGKPTFVPSRTPLQNDPAPLMTTPAPQGRRLIVLLSDPADVRRALTRHDEFSNIPYAALGGASFLLAQDPGPGYGGIDWHAQQQALIDEALRYYHAVALRALAQQAVQQAELTSLAQPTFDLAHFAEQAALRYFGILFGYGFQDHVLLEEACRSTYRALQYLAIGQHFVTEPLTLPAAQQALGRLATRTSDLMEAYTRLERSPRRYGPSSAGRSWPDGVQPWSELGLNSLGDPLLKRVAVQPGLLSGRDRAVVAATLLAGTLGNVQSAVCLLVQSLLEGDPADLKQHRNIKDVKSLEDQLLPRLGCWPPVPVVPRRTRVRVDVAGGVTLPVDTDCLVLLRAGLNPGCPHQPPPSPWIWGDVPEIRDEAPATHPCLGRDLATPLIAALVHRTLKLRGLRQTRDLLTAEPLKVERLWGFACVRQPLSFDRDQVRAQQNLIVSMRVKAPISENVVHLRRLIAAAIPRIDDVLSSFGSVHFAWFEFSDDDTRLVLRTIYDGSFEAYLEHFARRAGDLFDGLFEYLEEAPPRPVAEHPHEFVECIRSHNRAPLASYLYSAYPRTQAEQIRRMAGS
jgi:hypothetical protein